MTENDRRKPFNPLFLIKVSAIVKHVIPYKALEEMGFDPERIRPDKRGYTRIPCGLSEGGRVIKPAGLRQNYFQLGAEELKEENLVQVVADQDGERLQGRITGGRLFFSINQNRAVHLIRVREGTKDFVDIFRYRLTLNEDGDQNYLKCERIFPAKKEDKMENNDFTFFHYTMPSKLQEVVAGHLSKDVEFLAEAVTVVLEGAHSDNYPDYAKFPEPPKEKKEEAKETPPPEVPKKEVPEKKETEETSPPPPPEVPEEVPEEEEKKETEKTQDSPEVPEEKGPKKRKEKSKTKKKTPEEKTGNKRKNAEIEKALEEADKLDIKEEKVDKPDITESTPPKIVNGSPNSGTLTANLLNSLKKETPS